VNVIALGIFAVVAVVILFQLYNVLGKKAGFRPEEKPVTARTDDLELAPRIDRPVENRMPNLEVLKTRDSNFNEINFLEKAREAYEQVVLAFHRGELAGVKDKLSERVYATFSTIIAGREKPPADTLSFVDTPKADIDLIDFQDDVAQIRVRFLSELQYEHPAEPAEDVAVPVTTAPKPVRSYKRTAEYWTFQKAMRNANSPWLLTKVEAAKA